MRTRQTLALAIATSATVAVGALSAAPSAAKEYRSSATVLYVSDGDTLRARVAREGTKEQLIRLSGVQAVEKGECHYTQATRLLRSLTPKKSTVTLRALKKSSWAPDPKGNRRPLRIVENSRGEDVQSRLLAAGLTLPYTIQKETLNQFVYSRLGQIAAAQGLGLFDSDSCGVGPSQEALLRVWVNYDASGNDKQNVPGRYARIVNRGIAPVDIGGWWLRTAKHPKFVFPMGTWVNPGASVVVHMGNGVNGNGHFYTGSLLLFPNPATSPQGTGNAFLFDPDGDIRASTFYPCEVACENPLAGKVSGWVESAPEGNEALNPNLEFIRVSNTSGETIDMSHHVLGVQSSIHEFPAGTVLPPGASVTVHVGKGSDSQFTQYLNRTTPILPDGGAKAIVRTHEGIVVATGY